MEITESIDPAPPIETEWNLSFLKLFRVFYLPTERFGTLVSITRTGTNSDGMVDYNLQAEFEGGVTPITDVIENFILIYQAQ